MDGGDLLATYTFTRRKLFHRRLIKEIDIQKYTLMVYSKPF